MVIISLNNLPDAEERFMEVSDEQFKLMKRLEKLGAFHKDFIFEQIEIEQMAEY